MNTNWEITIYREDQDESFPVDVLAYPDGMPVINHKLMFGGFGDILVRPTSLSSFVNAMFLVDAMRERGSGPKRLILPSIPGARQDRLNPSGDYLFTLKSVAKMINERGFDEVVTVDPHSNVGPALIDRCRVIDMRGFWAEWIFDSEYNRIPTYYDAIIAPDAGASHRAQLAADVFQIPMIQAGKKRDVSTGKLSGFTVPKEAMLDRKYLIVDDICDGGGTFLGLRDILPFYAKVDLWVTHGIFSQGTEKLLQKFNNVMTSDSTVFKSPGVRKIEIIERLRTF